MVITDVGKNIRLCRTEKGMTMDDLGRAISKSPSTIADYEKGRVDIPVGSNLYSIVFQIYGMLKLSIMHNPIRFYTT